MAWLAEISAILGTLTALQTPPTALYNSSHPLGEQGITLQSWGSGSIGQTDETAYEGVNSLRLSTRNYFQGGILRYTSPFDLSSTFEDPNNLLRLTFLIADENLRLGGPGGTRSNAGGRRIDPIEQIPPTGQSGSASSSTAPKMRFVRLVITTTDGKRSETYMPVPSSYDDRGWRTVAIPVRAITGFDRTNKQVKEIWVSADATTTFYIGNIAVLQDVTPIQGEINATDLNLALGDEVPLSAYGYGGSSVLEYHWDFDASDGIQIDASGQSIRRKFRKAGTYTITLTVQDRYGLKKPYVTSIKATVNP